MTTTSKPTFSFDADSFIRRHIGPSAHDIDAMLDALGYDSLDAFIDATVPEQI